MKTTFYQFGVEYLRWEKNGCIYEAVKEQVEILGKECFECDIEDFDIDRSGSATYATEKDEKIADSFFNFD